MSNSSWFDSKSLVGLTSKLSDLATKGQEQLLAAVNDAAHSGLSSSGTTPKSATMPTVRRDGLGGSGAGAGAGAGSDAEAGGLDKLLRQNQELRDELVRRNNETAEREERIGALESEMALYQQKLTTAVQHLKRLTAENEDLAAKLLVQRENGTIELSTSNHLDHPNSNNHAADDKLMAANFQELESSAQARIHQLKSEHALELQSVNNLVASQRETISRLEEQASSSQKVSALESEIQTLSATHQHAVKRLEALLDNKEQELVEVGLTVEDLDLKCDELQAKLDQLEPQAGIMKDRIALLELENTELVSKLQHGASAVAQASTTPSNSYSLALPPSFAHTPITTTSPHLSTGFDDGWGTEDIIDSPTPPSEQVVITTSSNSLSPDFTSEILPRKDHVSRLEIENKSLKQRIDDLEVLNEGFHSRTGNVGKSDGLDIAGYDTINTTPKDGHGQQQCLTLRIKELEDSNARLNEEIETLRELSAVQDDGWGDNTVSCSPSTSHSKPSISISTEVEESYKTKISGLESLVAALNQDVQRCELEVVRCKEELEQQRHLKTQDQHLNSRVKELEDTIAKLNEEIETLRDLSVVQDDGWGAGNNISSSSHTNPPTSISSEMEETYKTKISHLESLVSVRNQDVQRCELELDRCKEELEYTKASTSRALDDTNTLNKKFMELTSKDQQQHQLLQNEQQQVQHLTQLLTENAESNAAKEESLRSQQNEMKLELSRVQSIFQEKCNQLVSELGLSKGRLVEFEAEIAQVTAQRDTLEKELVRSRQLHLEESNRKLEEKDQALEDLSLEIAKLNQLIGSLEAAEAESKRQLDHLQSALSHSKSDYSRLNEALMSICQDRKDVATREPLITAEVVSRRIAQLESENKDLRTRQLADSAQISPASSSSKTIEAHLVGEIFAAIVAWLDNALQHSFTENGEYTDIIKFSGFEDSILIESQLGLVSTTLCNLSAHLFELHTRLSRYENGLKQSQDIILQLKNDLEENGHFSNRTTRELDEKLTRVSNERDQLKSDYQMMLDKMREMKTVVGARLQEEIEEKESLKVENQSLSKNMGDLQAQLVEIQESYQLLQELYTNLSSSLHQDGGDEALSVSLELENTKDLLWKSQRELERLRQHMMEVEEERDHEVLKAEEVVKEYRVQMERLSHERQDVEALCEERINEISDLQEKLTQFEQIMVEKEEEYARIQEERIQTAQSVDNLQHALEEFQTSKDLEIEAALKGFKDRNIRLEQELNKWKHDAYGLKLKLESMEESIPTVSKIKADLAEKAALAERLKQELTQSQTYLAEAMRRMRDGSEETVDRRVIANLLITYILSPRGDKTRYEMLSVIANILKISDEEKYKIGVANKPPQSTIKDTTISADASIGSFTDMWVSFLMSATSETDAEKLLPLPTSSRKNSVLASPNPTPLSPASSTIKSPVIEGRAVDETLAGTAATSTTDGEVTPSKSSWLGSFGF